MSIIFALIGGAVLGVAGLFAFSLWYTNREDKQRKVQSDNFEAQVRQLVDQIKKNRENSTLRPPPPPPLTQQPADSVKERLRKAIDITLRQSTINVKGDNEKLLEYNNLELEKLSILKTILADGFDPPITIRYNTGDQEMPLSSYIASMQKLLH